MENVKVWLNVNFRVYIIDGVEVKDHSSSDSSCHQKILYTCMAFPIGSCFWINHSTKSNIKYINKTLLVHIPHILTKHVIVFLHVVFHFFPPGVIKACGNFREFKASFISSQTELSAQHLKYCSWMSIYLSFNSVSDSDLFVTMGLCWNVAIKHKPLNLYNHLKVTDNWPRLQQLVFWQGYLRIIIIIFFLYLKKQCIMTWRNSLSQNANLIIIFSP